MTLYKSCIINYEFYLQIVKTNILNKLFWNLKISNFDIYPEAMLDRRWEDKDDLVYLIFRSSMVNIGQFECWNNIVA